MSYDPKEEDQLPVDKGTTEGPASPGPPPPGKRKGGAPKSNRNAVRHGYYERKRQVQHINFDKLSRQNRGAVQLRERKQELIAHCGGENVVSAVTRRVIERTVLTEYLLDHLDIYLAEQGTRIIRRESRTVIPILPERTRLLQSLLSL